MISLPKTMKLPLKIDGSGAILVRDTPIKLETVVAHYHQGYSPESLCKRFDFLSLKDVYIVIAYYLTHREELDVYLKNRELAQQEVEENSAQSDTEFMSPRLRQLQVVLRNASSELIRTEVVQNFLAEVVEQGGTPLIETIDNDEMQVLATFLYQGDAETTNAYLHADFLPHPPKGVPRGQALTRLAKTHLWFYTIKISADIRTQYWLMPNDPRSMGHSEEENKKFMQTYLTSFDRLNPKRFVFPDDPEAPEGYDVIVSICEGPKAVPQPHIAPRPNVPAGKVSLHRFQSGILANERKVWVYTPPNYNENADEKYSFLLILDGRDYQSMLATPTLLDNLLADGLIPPMVCLFFDNASVHARMDELSPNEKLINAFREELLPWVYEHYHVTNQPEHSFIAGSSFGGLAAAWVALSCPDLFGNVISQSGAYWWFPKATRPEETDNEPGWLIRQYATRDRLSLRFYMDVGKLENADQWGGASHRGLNRHLCDVLRAKGYPVTYVEYSGGHDHIWWRQTLGDGLVAIQTL